MEGSARTQRQKHRENNYSSSYIARKNPSPVVRTVGLPWTPDKIPQITSPSDVVLVQKQGKNGQDFSVITSHDQNTITPDSMSVTFLAVARPCIASHRRFYHPSKRGRTGIRARAFCRPCLKKEPKREVQITGVELDTYSIVESGGKLGREIMPARKSCFQLEWSCLGSETVRKVAGTTIRLHN